MHGMPALAAYAAAAAPALPDELDAISLAPSCFAMVTAEEASRSLNDQVGLRDSSFTQTSPSPSAGTGSSGVSPSPSETASPAAAGRNASQRHSDRGFVGGRSRSRPCPGGSS